MIDLLLILPIVFLIAFTPKLVFTDFREHRLPNEYTLPLIAVTALSISANAVINASYERLFASLLAMGATFGIGLLLARFADLGMGDVKLLVSLNGWLAWQDPWLIALSLAIGLVTANIFALSAWLKRKDPGEHIALGPFLLLGFYITAAIPSWRIFTAVGESLA